MGNISFRTAETFVSINGESQLAGELALFIRFCGCNLRCSYCDTMWANEKNVPFRLMTADELCDEAVKQKVHNVTLTGGEPLLQENADVLIEKLGELGFNVEIETNGSIMIKHFSELKHRPSFTLDYKLPSSGMEKMMNTENYEYLIYKDTVKFVCGSHDDLKKAKEITDEYNLTEKCKVYFSPVFGKIEPAEIVDFMKENNMNGVRLQLQLHKFIWAPDAKGV